jgi:hypothetical protein
MTHKAAALVIVFALAACATKSTVAPYGQDTYILNVSDTMGTRQKTELRVMAAKEADAHCNKLGKKMQVEGAQDHGVAWLTSTSSQLIFRCI